MENGAEEDGMEMRAVSIDSFPLSFEEDEEYADESSGGMSRDAAAHDRDGDYGERTLAPRTVTKDNAPSIYRESVTRQNRLFGVGVFALAGLFVAAYVLMGLSFSPSNIGIFGDESSMRGGSGERTIDVDPVVRFFSPDVASPSCVGYCREFRSGLMPASCTACLFRSVPLCAKTGEVGLDADNAETQSMVDSEVIEMEESEHWGEMGDAKAAKKAKAMDSIRNHDEVGKHNWVEDKDWWEEFAPDMDPSKMTENHASEYYKLKRKEERLKRRCERHPDDKCEDGGKVAADLDSIREKLAHHYDEYHKDEQGAADDAAGGAVVDGTTPGGAGGVGTGEVAEDEDGGAGDPPEAVAEGTSPGGEDAEETSAPDGADGLAEDAAANEAGEVAKDADAEKPADDVDEGEPSPGGEDAEETSAPDGADGLAEDAAANEAGEVVKDADAEKPADDVDEGEPVEAPIQKSIVNEYTVLEQVGHDPSSFV
jgi:hypothetical protein